MEKQTVCYCFGYSEEDVIRDVLKNNGNSSILDRILNEKKKGGCHCSTNHPQGR